MTQVCGLAGLTLFIDKVLVSRFTGGWPWAGQIRPSKASGKGTVRSA